MMALQFTIFTLIISTIQWRTSTAVTYQNHVTTPQGSNFKLLNGDGIVSQDQLTYLVLQGDGNFVLYKRPNTGVGWDAQYAVWSSNTGNLGVNSLVAVQWDGNFIVYNTNSTEAELIINTGNWHGGKHAPNTLVVDNGGYAYIVTRTNNIIWQAGTANTITPSLTSLDSTCAFTVVSIDHVNTNNGKYFHFYQNKLDLMLGREDWGSNNFTVYNSRTAQFSKIIVWRSNNNGDVGGDAHGRKNLPDIAQDLDWQVNDQLTVMALDHECYTAAPTESPTSNTPSPTLSTSLPTTNTVSPTTNTNAPSVSTKSPSFMPTDLPTVSPTATTSFPSGTPTRHPTKQPSVAPTNVPTKSPTNVPTKSPTNVPTKSPTNVPTKSPTFRPSLNPTYNPSKSPVKDGAVDVPAVNTLYTTIATGANFENETQASNAKFLIIVILSVILALMGIGCIFVFICCWTHYKNKDNRKKAKEVEMKRITSISSIRQTNGIQTNTMTSASNGEGFDGVDETGNLPPEPDDVDGTDNTEQNGIFLSNVEPEAMQENVTPGVKESIGIGIGPFRNNVNDSDTDDDPELYKKPGNNITRGNNGTKGMGN